MCDTTATVAGSSAGSGAERRRAGEERRRAGIPPPPSQVDIAMERRQREAEKLEAAKKETAERAGGSDGLGFSEMVLAASNARTRDGGKARGEMRKLVQDATQAAFVIVVVVV